MNSNIHKLREKLMEELEKYGKKTGEMATPDLEAIWKLAKAIKDIDTCSAMEDYGDDNEYSNRSRMRDSMGRYSGSQNSYGRHWPMSYDDAKFNMVHKLGDLMMCTENEHTKSVLRNAISQLEGN